MVELAGVVVVVGFGVCVFVLVLGRSAVYFLFSSLYHSTGIAVKDLPCLLEEARAAGGFMEMRQLKVGSSVKEDRSDGVGDGRNSGDEKGAGEEEYILFRYLPELKSKLPYVQLGDYPTPVHRAVLPVEGGELLEFYVKREDLASKFYGGNKIRTLMHQIPFAALKLKMYQQSEGNDSSPGKAGKEIVVIGSTGSNQAVAALVHGGLRLGLPICPVLFKKDKAELANTLNLLSTFSVPGVAENYYTWATPIKTFLKLLKTFFWDTGNTSIVLPPGGHDVSGVLGQMSGVLELAEQIESGEVPDVDAIYLPIGYLLFHPFQTF